MPTPKPTIFFGDQFVQQAEAELQAQHQLENGGPLTLPWVVNSSPSDLFILSLIRQYLRGDTTFETSPRVVAMSYSSAGDSLEIYPNTDNDTGERAALATADYVGAGSSESGIGEWRTSPGNVLIGYATEEDTAVWDRSEFIESMQKIAVAAEYVDVPLFWVVPPPRVVGDPTPFLNESMREVATWVGMTVIRADLLVADVGGIWIESLPCLVDEGVPEGCTAGSIDIRDGVDFEFVGSYSSGARRWAGGAVAGMPPLSSDSEVDCSFNATWLAGCLPYYEGPVDSGPTTAIIGDSLVNFADAEIRADWAFRALTMRGIPGADLVDGRRRLVSEAVLAAPDHLFIELGLNSALYNWDAGDVAVLEDILTDVAGITHVVWVTVTCAEPNWYDHLGTGTLHDRNEDFKAALAAELPSFLNVEVADFGVEQDLHPEWWTDGVHMNTAGNVALASFMRGYIP